MSFSVHSYKTIAFKAKHSDKSKCLTCGNMVNNNAIKEKATFDKRGGLKVKGICPICKQFCKWIQNKESKYYGY